MQPFCWSLSAPLRPHANASGANKQHSLELHAVPHLTTRRTGPEAYRCQEYDIYLLNQAHFHGASGEGIFMMYGFGWTCGTKKYHALSWFVKYTRLCSKANRYLLITQSIPSVIGDPTISHQLPHSIAILVGCMCKRLRVYTAMAIHLFPVQRLPSCKKWILYTFW